MKKALIIIGLLTVLAFTEEKRYTLSLNDQELQALWYCIDNSNAPHSTVKQVQELINNQLASQVDTTKKK